MSPAENLPGVVLAAGRGTRFSSQQNKLLVPVRGQPVIYRSVKAMLDSILEPLLLVVGFQHERVLRALRELRVHPKLRAVVNERWAEGLSSSLKAALADLPEHATGVVILPGDMPLMTPQLIDRVARRFLGTGKLCFPVCQGQKGHPTAIPRALFAELWQLKGDVGAFSVVKAHWDEAERFELSSEEALTQLDIDAYEDCAHLEGR